jgi:hypothetical protein
MTLTHSNPTRAWRPSEPAPENEAVLEEVIDASLHTDRAHHDELGRTEEPVERNNYPEESPPSPREQPAVPIDVGKVDE